MDSKWRASIEVSRVFEWERWSKEIPFISFPSDWKIKIIPPFTGAVVRFRVLIPNNPTEISIYLDCYDHLGFFGEPYWEVYPHRGDVGRCRMSDTDELLRMIRDRSKEESEG